SLDSSLFFGKLRNSANSVYNLEDGNTVVDYTLINHSLSREVIRKSYENNINLRLVFAICTIENNFGNTKQSSSGAIGFCQTMPEEVRRFYGAQKYDNLSNDDKNWMHFRYTFDYLAFLRDKYNLKIGINDNPF